MATRSPRTPSPHTSDGPFDAPFAPRWGPRLDDQDMPRTRRSRRTTNNPFSSANNGKGKTPERTHEPPSPPASPSRHTLLATPRQPKSKKTARFAADRLSSSSRIDSTSLMLTPAKTPRNSTPPSTGTSRTVTFQHHDPSDAMPTPRKLKSSVRRSTTQLFGSRRSTGRDSFEIHTDWNARRPTLDLSEDNAFIGERSSPHTTHKRSRTGQPLPLTSSMSEEEMDERVKNDEGLIFSFRGKKVYRPYEDALADVAAAETLGYRPMRRSVNRPILLDFGRPAAEASIDANDTDEEAITDIDDVNGEPDDNGDLAASQSSVSERHQSAFASWARTKRDGAKGARKREVDELGAGMSAIKKPRGPS